MTARQYHVLFVAIGHRGHVRDEYRIAPHGVFRSLVIRQYLRPDDGRGYAITPEGRDAARRHGRGLRLQLRAEDRIDRAIALGAAS